MIKDSMKQVFKILLWGIGEKYNVCCNLLKYFQQKKEIQVVAITQKEPLCAGMLDDIPIINPKDALRLSYDYIMIMSEIYFRDICNELLSRDVSIEKIISCKVLFIPQVSMSKYFQLKKRNVSIISINCWGGIAYNILGLECLSPFKNLFLSDHDFLKVIRNLQYYMEDTPCYDHNKMDPHSGNEYPVLKLKDIFIHCNHSETADLAVIDWERRKRKINYRNLFMMMYTADPQIAKAFCRICEEENRKGVCFVPWNPMNGSKFQIQLQDGKSELWECVNNSVSMKGIGMHYDLIDLLMGENERGKNNERLRR